MYMFRCMVESMFVFVSGQLTNLDQPTSCRSEAQAAWWHQRAALWGPRYCQVPVPQVRGEDSPSAHIHDRSGCVCRGSHCLRPAQPRHQRVDSGGRGSGSCWQGCVSHRWVWQGWQMATWYNLNMYNICIVESVVLDLYSSPFNPLPTMP